MAPDGFKTQLLLLHSDQGTLDKMGCEFDLRYTVHLATSGSQALKALAEVPIDIFVSSQDLPGMSGLEALREAKKRSPQTHGILLTNATADEGEAFADDEEAFQIVRGDVTGEALVPGWSREICCLRQTTTHATTLNWCCRTIRRMRRHSKG